MKPSEKQRGYLSWRMRAHREILPEAWKDLGPKPGADWTMVNFDHFVLEKLDSAKASEAIAAFHESDEAGLEKLRSFGLPLRNKG